MYAFRIATEPRLSPAGDKVVFTLQSVAPSKDGYRRSLWIVPTDGSAPARQLTIGAKQDRAPRFSPDGRTLAFLSDRRLAVEELPGAPDPREDVVQVHLLPLDRPGEARRLTDLPRGVDALAWSPNGRQIAVLSASRSVDPKADARLRGKGAPKPPPGAPPESDYHYIDRLSSMSNGAGFIYGQIEQLWIVDVETGAARRLTDLPARIEDLAWSPDGRRIAIATNLAADRDISWGSDIHVVDVRTGARVRITGGRGYFAEPTWLPDGRTLAALGHRFPANAGSRADVWLFKADGSDNGPRAGRNLSGRHDLMPGSGMSSDVTVGEGARLAVTADGRSILFSAPVEGAYELWRMSIADGDVERLTEGRHYLSGWDAIPGRATGSTRIAVVRSGPTELPDVHLLDVPARTVTRPLELRRLTELNREALDGLALMAPDTRWTTVDGHRVQGWHVPAADPARPGRRLRGPAPLVLEIHGGPHTLYGWSPSWEFQCLAGAGIGVWYANPRGSEGYGQAFNAANFADWGHGPTRDVLGGVDALVADGARRRRSARGHRRVVRRLPDQLDRRPRPAVQGRDHLPIGQRPDEPDADRRHRRRRLGRLEIGAARGRTRISTASCRRSPTPMRSGRRCSSSTPRTTSARRSARARQLFTVLRSLRRPVRMMRVPGRDPRADPLRDAVPAGREPRPGRGPGSSTSSWPANAACPRCRDPRRTEDR